MRSHRHLKPLLVLASLTLVAAACGSDDGGSADDTAATEDSVAAEDTAAAETDAPASEDTMAAEDTTATEDTTASADAAVEDTAASEDTGDGAGGDADAALADLVAAAQEDGGCTIYSSQALDNLNNLADGFEDEYGISVEVVRGTDGDNIPRLETELSTNTAGADLVVMASTGWVVDHAEAGDFVDPSASPQIAGLGDYDAAIYVHEGNYFEVGAAVLTFAWNTDLVPDGINDMEDLLDPELGGGKLGVIDPAIAPAVVDFWLWLGETYGEDFVEALAAQEPRIYPSALPIGEALTSGEIYATPYAAPVQLVPAAESGAPVDFGISEAGAWGAKYFGFIPRTADDPACAALLADFMLTATGQELVMGVAGTVIPDVPGSLITNDQVRDQDLEGTAPEPAAEYVEQWNAQFR